MPMPWEARRLVKVAYHTTGALTVVDEIPRVIEPIFYAQWSCSWLAMRREKRERKNFRRVKFPPFDDEEPPLDYGENILHLPDPSPIELPLDEEEDELVYAWLFEHMPLIEDQRIVNGPSYKQWRLPISILSSLYRLSSPILLQSHDLNTNYLFDHHSFYVSKFEPDHSHPQITSSSVDEFNDVHKIVLRSGIRTEYRIAFPYVYHSGTSSIAFPIYHYPTCLSKPLDIEDLDRDSPAFTWRSDLFPIPPSSIKNDGDHHHTTRVELRPLFANVPLNPEFSSASLSLLHAPFPFNQRNGPTRRGLDVDVMKSWYHHRAPPMSEPRLRVAYQKLLKDEVKRSLGKRKKLRERKVVQSLEKLLKETLSVLF
ncbi:hypothetical protein GEMRC1_007534 [Eukaryota sp. GEM-RC1]